jgi:hypothetical protein
MMVRRNHDLPAVCTSANQALPGTASSGNKVLVRLHHADAVIGELEMGPGKVDLGHVA